MALSVRGPQLLARASQASVGYAFVFGLTIAALAATSPIDWGTCGTSLDMLLLSHLRVCIDYVVFPPALRVCIEYVVVTLPPAS